MDVSETFSDTRKHSWRSRCWDKGFRSASGTDIQVGLGRPWQGLLSFDTEMGQWIIILCSGKDIIERKTASLLAV